MISGSESVFAKPWKRDARRVKWKSHRAESWHCLTIVNCDCLQRLSFNAFHTIFRMPVSLILAALTIDYSKNLSGLPLNFPPGPRCPRDRSVSFHLGLKRILVLVLLQFADRNQGTLPFFLSVLGPAGPPILFLLSHPLPPTLKSTQTANPTIPSMKSSLSFAQIPSSGTLRSRGRRTDSSSMAYYL